MATSPAQFLRAVRAVPEPLGWYLRPSYVDHRAIADAVASGSASVYGVVFDPVCQARHWRYARTQRARVRPRRSLRRMARSRDSVAG